MKLRNPSAALAAVAGMTCIVVALFFYSRIPTTITCNIDSGSQAAALRQIGLDPRHNVDMFVREGRLRFELTKAGVNVGVVRGDRLIAGNRGDRLRLVLLEHDCADQDDARRWAKDTASTFESAFRRKGGRPLDETLQLPFALTNGECELHFSCRYGSVNSRRVLIARCNISLLDKGR